MNTESQLPLATTEQAQLAINPNASPVVQMIDVVRMAVQSGVTPDKFAMIEKMMDACERMERRDAEKQFNAAFVALQNDLPVIVATTIIPNRGKYEKFEDVMKVVGPLLVKHGFTVDFAMDFNENRIVETCHLRHVAGHSKSNSFAVRVSGKADSETQADCKAATTAKRNALLNCLNIVIRQDALQSEDDAGNEGEPTPFEKVQYLKEQIKEAGSDEAMWLRMAGVEKWEDIREAGYTVILNVLEEKKRKRK